LASLRDSVDGVEIMFSIRGGIAGDGVAGFKGEVGMVGLGMLPQASRNRRMSAALAWPQEVEKNLVGKEPGGHRVLGVR
jgi:hypothetical protein